MIQFLIYAAAAACAAIGIHAQTIPCVPLDFNQASADISSLNSIIDIAVGSNLLKQNLVAYDPLVIKNKRLDAVPFSVLGTDFTLTPVIQTLQVNGISNVKPRHLNISAATNLAIGADFDGELALSSTLSFEIAQLNHKWWQICWTNLLKPKDCPPAIVDLDAAIGLANPSIVTNALVSMLKCPPTAPRGTCKDITVTDILVAGLSEVAIADLGLAFDQITQLNFHFHKSGPLLTELGKKLLGFSTAELNKKGDLYKNLIGVCNKLGKTLVNKVLQEKLAPSFGATCYDA